MAVIALVGNKGGAGKTTLAINLAAGLAENGSTTILDADPQQSSWQWGRVSAGQAGVSASNASESLDESISRAREEHDHVVVDCPPSVHAEQTKQALRLVDVALVPVQPSPMDIWATVHIESEVVVARKENPGLRALLVINQLEPRTKLSRLMRDALAQLEIPTADTAVTRKMIFRSAILEGKSVLHVGMRGAEEAQQIRDLIEEVLAT